MIYLFTLCHIYVTLLQHNIMSDYFVSLCIQHEYNLMNKIKLCAAALSFDKQVLATIYLLLISSSQNKLLRLSGIFG